MILFELLMFVLRWSRVLITFHVRLQDDILCCDLDVFDVIRGGGLK